MSNIKDVIWAIAQANPHGFTYNLRTGNLAREGLVAAYEATQNSFGYESLEQGTPARLSPRRNSRRVVRPRDKPVLL